jgi:Rap1a immunity proteins
MLRYISFSILLLTSLFLPVSALSESLPIPNLTTGKLNSICNQLLNDSQQAMSFNHGLCVGIILGVEDNAHYDKKICVPRGVDIKERIRVVNQYIATQPNREGEAFASLTFDAMAQKWPCRSK